MRRPRWHDAVLVTAIVLLFALGVWALWWEDVRAVLHLGPRTEPGSGSAVEPSLNTSAT